MCTAQHFLGFVTHAFYITNTISKISTVPAVVHFLTLCKGQEESACHLWYYPKEWLCWIPLCSRSLVCRAQMGKKGQPQHSNGQGYRADILLQKLPLEHTTHMLNLND